MTGRRDFLRKSILGTGSFLFPGGMSALAASQAFADGLPRRFIFVRKSNGIRPKELSLPTFSAKEKRADERKEAFEVDLDQHEFPGWLRPLERFREHVGILQGLSSKMSENGHWSYSSVMGVFKSGRNSLSGIKRATVDFELAKLFPSAFGHVELSLTGNYSSFRKGIVAGYSAPAPHQRNYCYADPQTAYDELFRSVVDPAATSSDRAMLKFLEKEESFKARSLAGYEKLKLENHIDSVEAIQRRNEKLKKLSGEIRRHLPKISEVHRGGGDGATTPEKQKAMTDVLIAALVTGLTNVVTYTIDELSTPVKGLPGNEGDHISIHEIGHGGGYSGVSADQIREKIRVGHLEQVARIVDRLKEIPEGKGTMFDRTMILYFPENGEGHHSWGSEAPFVVVAGNECAIDLVGRYVRLPYHATEGHQTLGNWYTTLLNAYGNPIKHYGDFDLEMSRKKLKQEGAIQQLLRSS